LREFSGTQLNAEKKEMQMFLTETFSDKKQPKIFWAETNEPK
jgi:hypothetical protein